jgi:hypothetical protein
MENQTATTVENDLVGYSDLKNQILENKQEKPSSQDIRDEKPVTKEETPFNKKFIFRRGDESVEIDDDFELEIMADKRPIKLSLKDLRDRAAGDVAIKNRMHSLAEEKKRVQSTFKEFAELSKKDPLGALEFISAKATEADSEFAYDAYIEKLAEQAEKYGQMDEKDRKALDLEKKLEKAETDLSLKNREAAVILRKEELQTEYPEVGDSQFASMVDTILTDEALSQGLEDENDVMDRVEDLIQETLTQRDIMSVIQDVNPSYLKDKTLIFSLSDQIRQNPDLDEEDIRDIVRQLVEPQQKIAPEFSGERQYASKILSQKARQSTPIEQVREQNMTPYELLTAQLIEKQNEIKKTPLYKR